MSKSRLVLLSFLMLFTELALIRWLGSNVVYLSYFSNFVLLGSFLGIGLGFMRAKSKPDFFPWALVALAGIVTLALAFPVTIDRSGGSSVIYFGQMGTSGPPMWLALPVIFALVALVMAAIAQGVGRAFAQFEPLEAYRLDILGSLSGIVVFSVLSFLQAPPIVWGFIACGLLLALYAPKVRIIHVIATAVLLLALGAETFTPWFSWSPYYKIAVLDTMYNIKVLMVNGIPHQTIESTDQRRILEPAYFAPYQQLRGNPLDDVLIIGAGNGSDVAIALASGAKHVDAVEIDPKIYQIGKRIHPNHPYQDPRVSVHINDGRAFLQQSHQKYDLILYALPDSLILVAGQSSLRLESYLFTIESIRTARAHLKPHGAFAMYNFYREDWLIHRLAATVGTAFGQSPCVDTYGYSGRFAVIMAANDPSQIACRQPLWALSASDPAPVDDDHPFVYLKSNSIPPLYLITILAVLLVSIALTRAAAGSLSVMRGDLDLFCMGAAFMLLETKNIVQFALLFGTTWFVNALVFFGILLTVYLAVEVAKRIRQPNIPLLYGALLIALLTMWAVPPQSLLGLDPVTRFVAATALAFAPVFLANLIFAERFRESASSTLSFGANLLGAMAGGILEYASLIIGYRSLVIVVALLYVAAFALQKRSLPRTVEAFAEA